MVLAAVQVRQWAEIQAHSRKLSLEEFLQLAEEKKQELQQTLQVSTCLSGPAGCCDDEMGLLVGTSHTVPPSPSLSAVEFPRP